VVLGIIGVEENAAGRAGRSTCPGRTALIEVGTDHRLAEPEPLAGVTPTGRFIPLTPVQQKGGKIVHAWAFSRPRRDYAPVAFPLLLPDSTGVGCTHGVENPEAGISAHQ
jgi:hypothetical protein